MKTKNKYKHKYNYGNIHEIMSVLSIFARGEVYYIDTETGTTEGRNVALLNSPMTGEILLQNEPESFYFSKVSKYNGAWQIISTHKREKSELIEKMNRAEDAFNALKSSKGKTSSIDLPKDIADLMNFLGISPKTASSKEKFDCEIVLNDNFNRQSMKLKAGQKPEVLSLKSPDRGQPTLLNASGDNVCVIAKISGEGLRDPAVVSELLTKKPPKELLNYIYKKNLFLCEFTTSHFVQQLLGGSSSTFAEDIFKAFREGGPRKNFENFDLSKKQGIVVENFLKNCASGRTATSFDKGLSQIGHSAHLIHDGKVVLTPYDGDDIGRLLMYSCRLDTPSLTRHSKDKNGILVRCTKEEKTENYHLYIPFQIRKVKNRLDNL